MKGIVYRVTLLEPVLVTALEGDPNSGVSFPYIPGSALRGLVVARYQRCCRTKDLARDKDARRLFFDGSTRYLNAYPLDRLGKRTAPTPLSLHRVKGGENTIRDFAADEPPEKNKQWQTVNVPFCVFSGSDVGDDDDGHDDDEHEPEDARIRLVRPERRINVHTARNRRYGRAVDPRHAQKGEDPGAVYRYDALAAGQTFEAAILCDCGKDARTLEPLLEGEAYIGRSRSAGYGRARIELVGEQESGWKEASSMDTGAFVVTFLSDALIRGADGQFTTDPRAITDALKKRLRVGTLSLRAKDSVFLRGRETGGFNRKWNLPLPQALAVQMGSTLVYETPQDVEQKICELEEQGIGERRAEGFGRVAVNWHGGETELRMDEISKDTELPQVDLSKDPAADAARAMVERVLRKRLDGAVALSANRLGEHVRHPTNSQLSRLRAVLQDALPQSPCEGRKRILAYLEDIEKRQSAGRQFGRDRVEGKRLLEWLRFRIEDKEKIWETLEVTPPSLGGIKAETSVDLAYEYNLRLIDAVLARAIKQNR